MHSIPCTVYRIYRIRTSFVKVTRYRHSPQVIVVVIVIVIVYRVYTVYRMRYAVCPIPYAHTDHIVVACGNTYGSEITAAVSWCIGESEVFAASFRP